MGHYTTQRNHKEQVMEKLRGIEYYVVAGKWSHGRYLDALSKMYTSNSWQRLTRYNIEYIRGRRDQWQHYMEQQHIEWRVYHPELGHLHSERDRETLQGIWNELTDMGAHFWKGTNKVWSAGDNTLAVMQLYPDEHEHELKFHME